MNAEMPEGYVAAAGGDKYKFEADLKGVVADARDLLRNLANSTENELDAERSGFDAKLSEIMGRLADAKASVERKAHSVAEASSDYIRDNPWKIAGGALAGFVAAIVLSRCLQRHCGKSDSSSK